MSVELDLSTIWRRVVEEGRIRNQFKDATGRHIESGVRMADRRPEHYALDLDSGAEMGATVVEKRLPGARFILQLNLYRALKPRNPIVGLGRQSSYSDAVEDCNFACRDVRNPLSLLRRHAPLQIRLRHFQWAALPNAFPVEKNGHFLWVPVGPEPGARSFPHYPQVMTLSFLCDYLKLAFASRNVLTLFNSMHAGASVHHIHFHSVQRPGITAIEESSLVSVGEYRFIAEYPASGLVFIQTDTAEAVWHAIAKLQRHGVPYNLVGVGGRVYLLPRNIDAEVVPEFPSGSLAGMELSGKAITTEPEYYEQANWDMFTAALRKSTLRNEEIVRLLDG